ncbi:MAG TPA: hypothetical protein ENH11_04725 [Candidatus Acetothermia bacterium]|nr:hypothetical protein [Candidatus Acetothermia bacterium]
MKSLLKGLSLMWLLISMNIAFLGAQTIQEEVCESGTPLQVDTVRSKVRSALLTNAVFPGDSLETTVLVYRVDGVSLAVGFARYRTTAIFERVLAFNGCVHSFPAKGEYQDSIADTRRWNELFERMGITIGEPDAPRLAILYQRLITGQPLVLGTEAQTEDEVFFFHPIVSPEPGRWRVTLKGDPPLHEDKYDIVVQFSLSGEVIPDP